MPDIVSGKIWVDAEKGVTATKMNQQFSGAVIQPSFVTSKPASSTLDPTDQLLEVKSTGNYATITGQQLIDSVSASVTQNINPSIWSVRLRSFNALGASNPTFEVDQRNADGSALVNTNGAFPVDRWSISKAGTMVASFQQNAASPPIVVPGTSFAITRKFLRVTLTTQQATLGATDQLSFQTIIEGPTLRELINDVHSESILVRSSVAPLKFSLSICDPTGTRSLCNLCAISSASTWSLLTFPNLPVFPTAGTFNLNPGASGYILRIGLAAGSSYVASANGVWVNANAIGALGQDSFAAQAVSSTFDIAFAQHEPGAQCSTLIDCPFGVNLDGPMGCLRYFQKTYDYVTKPGTTTSNGSLVLWAAAANHPYAAISYKKTMAKPPVTILGYSPATSTVGALRDMIAATDRAISAVQFVGDAGFGGFTLTTTNAAMTAYQTHYTVDTGW